MLQAECKASEKTLCVLRETVRLECREGRGWVGAEDRRGIGGQCHVGSFFF